MESVTAPRLDVCMLSIDEPAAWRDEAINSMQHPGIALHVIPTSRTKTIGADWRDCIASSALPYIMFADPDNVYFASAIMALVEALDNNTNAVIAYSDEALIDAAGNITAIRQLPYTKFHHRRSAALVHSCVVMRREVAARFVDQVAGLNIWTEWALTRLMSRVGDVIHAPIIGRHWRQHPGQAHRRAVENSERVAFNSLLSI